MKPLNSAYFTLIFPIIVLALFAAGCRREADPALQRADALMELYPDSALSLLDNYSLKENASDYDRAMHGMLLAHARYKNFVDETDDSLINASVRYFLSRDMKEMAARSLFLQGVIQGNAGNAGESAVSFLNGLDMARECGAYMWEGKCARELSMLYGKLLDTSAQLKYANEEYEAFSKGECGDWISYARLDKAVAYNNSQQHDRAISEARLLQELAAATGDNVLLEESLVLEGTAQFAAGNFRQSLEKYHKAYLLNPGILNEKHIYNISYALDAVNSDTTVYSFPEALVASPQSGTGSFAILASKGRYEEAYSLIEQYKNRQDSLISTILKSNVKGAVSHYEDTQQTLRQEKRRIERFRMTVAILLLLALSLVAIWYYRERMLRNKHEFYQVSVLAENLKEDLQLQLAKIELLHTSLSESRQIIQHLEEQTASNSSSGRRTDDENAFVNIFREKYAEINGICEHYFQYGTKNDTAEMKSKIKGVIKTFTKGKGLKAIEDNVDAVSDNLFSSFKKDFPDTSEDGRKLFLYIVLGFSSLTICVLLGMERDNVYNRKSRLKEKIRNSKASRKEEYLRYF